MKLNRKIAILQKITTTSDTIAQNSDYLLKLSKEEFKKIREAEFWEDTQSKCIEIVKKLVKLLLIILTLGIIMFIITGGSIIFKKIGIIDTHIDRIYLTYIGTSIEYLTYITITTITLPILLWLTRTVILSILRAIYLITYITLRLNKKIAKIAGKWAYNAEQKLKIIREKAKTTQD